MLVSGTVMIPLSVDDQIKESDGVIQARFVGQLSRKLPSGDVVTEGSFRLIKSVGLETSVIVNSPEFKLSWPGGSWEGITWSIEGAPVFQQGEEAVIILKRRPWGYQIVNLSQGKYKLRNEGDDAVLVNEAFPQHPLYGKISYREFEDYIKKKFGSDFRDVPDSMQVYIDDKNTPMDRSIAATHDAESETKSPIIWSNRQRISTLALPGLLLAAIGIAFAIYFKRRKS
jgi:hypothetical protein